MAKIPMVNRPQIQGHQDDTVNLLRRGTVVELGYWVIIMIKLAIVFPGNRQYW